MSKETSTTTPPPDNLPPRLFHGTSIALLFTLFVFIWTAFLPSLSASFIDLDDSPYVFNNPHVLTGLSLQNTEWAFTHRYTGFYMPMTWLSLQLDASVTNTLQAQPLRSPDKSINNALPDAHIFHFTNILLHCFASATLFVLLYRLTRMRWPAFFVALLWAVHPLRVESVTWVTERKDEIAGLFGFLAILLYVLALEKKKSAGGWRFGLCCIFFILSVWGKAMCVTLPILLLLLDICPLQRITNAASALRAVLEKWPLWIIALASAVVTLITSTVNGTLPISRFEKIENGILSYIRYIEMQADIYHLAPFYPYLGSPPFYVAAATVLLLLFFVAAFLLRKKCPFLLTGYLWYLIAALPVIGFVQSFTQAYADRFSYLPSIGLIAILVFFIAQLRMPKITIPLGFSIAAYLAFITFVQAGYWHDTHTLMARELQIAPPTSLAYASSAQAFARESRFDLAEQNYRSAIQLSPDRYDLHQAIALVYMEDKQPDLALDEAKTAVSIAPDMVSARDAYGKILYLNGRYAQAVSEFETASQLAPADEDIRRRLAAAKQKFSSQ